MSEQPNFKPLVRIRASTNFQASTKRIEPDVTVEISLAHPEFTREEIEEAGANARMVAMEEFRISLALAEKAIKEVRPE